MVLWPNLGHKMFVYITKVWQYIFGCTMYFFTTIRSFWTTTKGGSRILFIWHIF